MINKSISSVISLIESGNIIYEKAISNIDSNDIRKNLFDIYAIKKCAEFKLKSLSRPSKPHKLIPDSYTINARRHCIEAEEKRGRATDNLYLEHLSGIEEKTFNDIVILSKQAPELRQEITTIKREIERCRHRINNLRPMV
ncbi:DUF2383 domain-containing protein [Vibrio coralliilyticus]|uniref:DUF2383 domain-containing protein n=1 Tax=Vibrio coralliilyticus TaxID=190893 RepID=A0AAP7DFA9_9VIBR|nr:DUF2383 domain-containing protein [Vibrio coralliilyticus]NOJ26093.1 DUF2383 domain-containing protein [Vibrio coralliilyticus]